MSDRVYGVAVGARSTQDIRNLAADIRTACGIALEDRFPATWFLEVAMVGGLDGFDWEVDETLSSDMEACAFPDGCPENPEGPFIKIRPDVYEAAHSNDGRARFTLMHECGHILLHQNISALHRSQSIDGEELPPYKNSEWQANTFAAELLMPPKSFIGRRSLQGFCSRMAVSHAAARAQGTKLMAKQLIPNISWLVA